MTGLPRAAPGRDMLYRAVSRGEHQSGHVSHRSVCRVTHLSSLVRHGAAPNVSWSPGPGLDTLSSPFEGLGRTGKLTRPSGCRATVYLPYIGIV